MKRFTRPTLVCLALFFALAPAAAAQTTATVAAWNLGGFEEIPDSRVENIARAINRLRPDVVALTEVNPAQSHNPEETVLQKIVDRLDEDYLFLYFPNNHRQNIALLYRDGVEVTDDRLIPGSDNNNSDLRRALAARVKIRDFDFILIAVHMKSSRGEPHHTTRNDQARAIASFIEAQTAGAEKDVLLVGDYNMIPGEDDENFSNISPDTTGGEEFLRFISSEPPVRTVRTHIGGCSQNGATISRGNHLDGFAVTRSHTREFREGSLRAVPFNSSVFRKPNGQNRNCESYRTQVSDHLVLIANFQVTADDDN